MATQFAKFATGIDIGNEGDGVDKLHFVGVPRTCMACLSLLTIIKFFDIKPMLCWVPYQFTSGAWVEYATWYCYVSNTFLPNNKEVFGEESIHDIQNGNIYFLKYYQWVPFIFIAIAILYYLPRLVWQGILEAEGVNITAMVKTVNGFESAMDVKKRETALEHISKYLMVHFENKRNSREKRIQSPLKKIMSKVLCISRTDSSYVGRTYLLVKVL
jgi:hypothetical protein